MPVVDEALRARRRRRRRPRRHRGHLRSGPGGGAPRRRAGGEGARASPGSKPLVRVNHLEGHLLAAFLSEEPPAFPYLGLVVSGGHTSLYVARGLRPLPAPRADPRRRRRRGLRQGGQAARPALPGRRGHRPAGAGGRSTRRAVPQGHRQGRTARLQLLRPQDGAPPPREEARRPGGAGARRPVRQLPGGHRGRARRRSSSGPRASSSSTGWCSRAAWPPTAGCGRRWPSGPPSTRGCRSSCRRRATAPTTPP